MSTLAPLEDPNYEPFYRPVGGKPNPIVAKWGPRSQLRWFRRFWREMGYNGVVRLSDVKDYYCHSVEHKGPCCASCISDEEYFGAPVFDDHCCCEGYRATEGKE